MTKSLQCTHCHGTGAEMIEHDDDHSPEETCWACAPTGMIQTECYYCEGSGQRVVCSECRGDGCFMCEYEGAVKI